MSPRERDESLQKQRQYEADQRKNNSLIRFPARLDFLTRWCAPLSDEEDKETDTNRDDEDPLNSGDDVSNDESSEMFETDNVVVCQYDKITRNRNKWKFHLKDGIMNINGRDYVFQKAVGDAEW